MPEKSTLHAMQGFSEDCGLYDDRRVLRDQFFAAFTLPEVAGGWSGQGFAVDALGHGRQMPSSYHSLQTSLAMGAVSSRDFQRGRRSAWAKV